MQLIDKTIHILSELQEIASGQLSLHPGVNSLIIILEDLHSLLTESINLDNNKSQLKENDIELIDYKEDWINDSTKQSLTINMESALDACKSISAKNKSGIFKKALHFIKNKLLDDPEETLKSRQNELWKDILQARIDLKKNNFAINVAQILQEKANKGRKIINKGAEEEQDDSQQNQARSPANSMFNLKNKDNKNCGDILDDVSANNRLSFDTPLPPGQNMPCVTKLLNPSQNQSQSQQSQPSSQKKSLVNKSSEVSYYELQPVTHERLKEKKDELKEVSFKGIINFEGNPTTDFFSFKRQQFQNVLVDKGDLGRVSRNHASLRAKKNENDQISYFLVNHSPNGCCLLKEGATEWIRIKDIGAEIEIAQNDMIGIIFDSTTQKLLLGYKLCFAFIDLK